MFFLLQIKLRRRGTTNDGVRPPPAMVGGGDGGQNKLFTFQSSWSNVCVRNQLQTIGSLSEHGKLFQTVYDILWLVPGCTTYFSVSIGARLLSNSKCLYLAPKNTSTPATSSILLWCLLLQTIYKEGTGTKVVVVSPREPCRWGSFFQSRASLVGGVAILPVIVGEACCS